MVFIVVSETPRCDVSTSPVVIFWTVSLLYFPYKIMFGFSSVLAHFRAVFGSFRLGFAPVFVTKTGSGRAGRALRLFMSQYFYEFLIADFVLKSYRFCAVRPSLGYNGAALRVWRRPRCIVVRPSLQSRKGFTASSSRSCGKAAEMVWFVSGCKLVRWKIHQKKLINIPDF